MPREFFTDFVKVAQDEGRHFSLLAARLEELGSFYGALPAHDGLWDSATVTSKDLLARLAVEHCVHEVGVIRLNFSNFASFMRTKTVVIDIIRRSYLSRFNHIRMRCYFTFLTILRDLTEVITSNIVPEKH